MFETLFLTKKTFCNVLFRMYQRGNYIGGVVKVSFHVFLFLNEMVRIEINVDVIKVFVCNMCTVGNSGR